MAGTEHGSGTDPATSEGPGRAQGLHEGPYVDPEAAALGCRDVTKQFGAVTAVDHVSIGIDEGEWVSIVGPNGAGKTSLLNVFNGFYSPDSGRVFLGGEDITGLRSYKRARRGLARTFQGVELFEHETVFENIVTIRAVKERPNLLEAALFYRLGQDVEVENARAVEEIIDYLELWEYRDHTITALPLGVRRRVELARALALEPKVLLLDEAMSGLTFDEKYDMVRFVTDLHEEQGLTIVMIEHDLEVVTAVSERIIVLHQGGLLARGTPDAVTQDSEVRRVYTEVD